MLSLHTLFWILVVFFGLIGMLRGWTREIIATSGLVLSLFAQLWFGQVLIGLVAQGSAEAIKNQFYVRAAAHIAFAFFSYQGPALVRHVAHGRFGDKARSGLQESTLGFIVGAINGYLIIGTLWSFLEYNIVDRVAIPYAITMPYPFPESIITRPASGPALELIASLPLPLLQGWLPLLVVVLFLFVIIAMI